MNRRHFIKLSFFTTVVLSQSQLSASQESKPKTKTLVLIEFDGGNDGLNTVVPYTSKEYYSLRKDIALHKKDLNIISKEFAINKNLGYFKTLYDENNLAIVNGLGYDNPNLSHFRSIDIVETASNTSSYETNGWLHQVLEQYSLNDTRPANAMVIGKRKKGLLFSSSLDVLQIKNINNFIKQSNKLNTSNKANLKNESLSHLFKQHDSISKANKSLTLFAKDIKISKKFEDTNISTDLKEALKIIKSPINIPVIKISHSGYDTHANQIQRQGELFSELNSGLYNFIEELKSAKLFDDVLIVTYSEFGRRAKQNASLGSDHGTASCQFVIGGSVKGGLYGKHPSLNTLDKDNLIYTTHYRSYYNTILKNWFNYPKNKFREYGDIGFL